MYTNPNVPHLSPELCNLMFVVPAKRGNEETCTYCNTILMTQDIKEGKETVKAVYIFHLNTHSFIRKIHVLLSLQQSGSLSLTHLLKYDGNIPLLSSADFQNCTIYLNTESTSNWQLFETSSIKVLSKSSLCRFRFF